jgi:REP element-mobilizing transposase RayT
MRKSRKSRRLKGYDYSSVGNYFITIVVQNRLPMFGKVVDRAMQLNDFGRFAGAELNRTEVMRDNISLGEYIIMPDHIHMLIHINKHIEQPEYDGKEKQRRAGVVLSEHMIKNGSISTIIRGYKSKITSHLNKVMNEYIENPRLNTTEEGELCYRYSKQKSLWQRNYHDCIIRSQRHYDNVTRYINYNPAKWDQEIKAGIEAEGNE